MERLTIRTDNDINYLVNRDAGGSYNIIDLADIGEKNTLRKISNKLAAYEDTGLEPEEIPTKEFLNEINEKLEKYYFYRSLELQGLLIKIPCKVGGTVYFIKSAFSMAAFPIEANHVSIRGINCDGEIIYSAITAYNKIERRFSSADFGKTVFLTREEAKEALEGMKNEP